MLSTIKAHLNNLSKSPSPPPATSPTPTDSASAGTLGAVNVKYDQYKVTTEKAKANLWPLNSVIMLNTQFDLARGRGAAQKDSVVAVYPGPLPRGDNPLPLQRLRVHREEKSSDICLQSLKAVYCAPSPSAALLDDERKSQYAQQFDQTVKNSPSQEMPIQFLVEALEGEPLPQGKESYLLLQQGTEKLVSPFFPVGTGRPALLPPNVTMVHANRGHKEEVYSLRIKEEDPKELPKRVDITIPPQSVLLKVDTHKVKVTPCVEKSSIFNETWATANKTLEPPRWPTDFTLPPDSDLATIEGTIPTFSANRTRLSRDLKPIINEQLKTIAHGDSEHLKELKGNLSKLVASTINDLFFEDPIICAPSKFKMPADGSLEHGLLIAAIDASLRSAQGDIQSNRDIMVLKATLYGALKEMQSREALAKAQLPPAA